MFFDFWLKTTGDTFTTDQEMIGVELKRETKHFQENLTEDSSHGPDLLINEPDLRLHSNSTKNCSNDQIGFKL